jgi:hypothetical protein
MNPHEIRGENTAKSFDSSLDFFHFKAKLSQKAESPSFQSDSSFSDVKQTINHKIFDRNSKPVDLGFEPGSP